MKQILSESIDKKYAVGAFDTNDYDMTEAIIGTAEKKEKPVILMAMSNIFMLPNYKTLFRYLVNRCEHSDIPIALHYDHGKTFEGIMLAIKNGCTSVMFDGSSLPLKENIEKTKKICEIAHACGVSVEGEIGHVSGHEGNMLDGNVADVNAYSNVGEAVQFAQETGVDALAVAIGTVHGVYKGEPVLDYKRLSEIRNSIDIPLVMHGGSGLSPEDFRKAINCGINKINFFTGLSLGAADAVIKLIEERRTKLRFGDIVKVGIERASEIVGEHIDIFGTQALTENIINIQG